VDDGAPIGFEEMPLSNREKRGRDRQQDHHRADGDTRRGHNRERHRPDRKDKHRSSEESKEEVTTTTAATI